MTGSTEELDRLESWKQIAAHLNKSERTVRRWHELEGLPVHKHQHRERGSVWAYRSEVDQWLADRTIRPEVQPSRPPRRKWPFGIGVVAAIAAILGILVTRPRSDIRSAERAVPLTALPGSEYGASFSPDGKRVVFFWGKVDQVQNGLYVKEVDKEAPAPVLSPVQPKVFFYSPAWSPDGATIAFLERTATDGTWLCVIDANGGVHRRLRQIAQPPDLFIGNNQHVSWSPDGRFVIVPIARGNERGIYRISLATSEAVVITKAESAYAPAISPDGRLLVWLRRKGLPIAYEEIVLTRLREDGTADGDPVLLHKGNSVTSGIAWASNKSLVVCSSEATVWASSSRLYQLPAVAGAGMTEFGGDGCTTVTVSAKRMMAYGSTVNSRSKLLRTSLQTPVTPRELVPSSRYDSDPSFSQDGGRIAFYSNRSGVGEIWVVNSDGSGLRKVTENSKVHSGPSWSPAGNEIVYASGRSLLISTLTGKVTRVDVDGPVAHHPVWSADGNTIYFTSGNYLYQAARDGRGRKMIRELADVLMLAEKPDGRHLYYSRPGQPFVLLRMHSSGSQEEVVEERMGLPCFAITRQALYVVRRDMALYALPHSGGHARRITSVPLFENGGNLTWETRFTVSPDDSTIVWVRPAPQEIDLAMRRLP